MSELNPYRDSSPFGRVTIDAVLIPGVIQSLDGAEKPEEWAFQKGTSGNNATSVWKGTKLAESIKIVTALFDEASYDAYSALKLWLRPKLGTKPPSRTITSPIINSAGISKISTVNTGTPKWVRSGGYWTAEITLAEYNPPKPAATGQAGPANSSTTGTPPQTEGEKQLEALLKQAASL